MADVKFGVKQLNSPTPKYLKNFFKAFLFLSGAWAIIAPAATQIPAGVQADINKWIIVGLALMRFAISFWGYDYKIEPND